MADEIKNTDTDYRLSVVVPVFNEEAVLPAFHRRLVGVLDTLSAQSEIVYVNDGSIDGSLQEIRRLKMEDAQIGRASWRERV